MWSKRGKSRQRKLKRSSLHFLRILLVIITLRFVLIRISAIKNEWENMERAMQENNKMRKIADRMEARRLHLKAECARTGLDGSEYYASTWEFLVNRKHHIIWCHVFKAASSSWLYNFNIMANYSPEFLNMTRRIPVQLARLRYPRPTLDMVKEAQLDSKTFIIVRHPLERLASAYRDKIVHAIPKTSHYLLRLLIVKHYRANVTKTTKPLNKRPHPVPDPYRRIPFFEEFVSYVLDEAKAKKPLDMHWIPYTTFCTPCKIHYDFILKMETLDEDQRYLIEVSNLTGVVKAQWRNKRKNNLSYINSLYSRISKEQLDGLYELYKYDFQLFNYSIDNYYDVLEQFMNKRTLTTEIRRNR